MNKWFVANENGEIAGHDMTEMDAKIQARELAEKDPWAFWEALYDGVRYTVQVKCFSIDGLAQDLGGTIDIYGDCGTSFDPMYFDSESEAQEYIEAHKKDFTDTLHWQFDICEENEQRRRKGRCGAPEKPRKQGQAHNDTAGQCALQADNRRG